MKTTHTHVNVEATKINFIQQVYLQNFLIKRQFLITQGIKLKSRILLYHIIR